MSKYCHDDSIHNCLIKCEECSAYYDDNELENFLVTEKDQRDFIEAKIRAEERKNVIEELLSETENWKDNYGSFLDFQRMLRNKLRKEQK